ncbi:MAG TPA: aminoglycoside phosphotransferase family protein [Actinocrinis sp.]|jgi:hypothetical protein
MTSTPVGGGVELVATDHEVVHCRAVPDAAGAVAAVEPLVHNLVNAAVGGIWRVRGSRGSAVLKIARPPAAAPDGRSSWQWQTSDEPTHFNYWRREVLAYETGLAATVYADAGITAPELIAADPRADGGVELWLADVGGPSGFRWPVPRLARFAYELGAAQARWTGRVPQTEWLSRNWLSQYLTYGPISTVSQVRRADWDHPGVAVWPAEVRYQLLRLWAEWDRALAAAQAAERTLCHLDVWPANLLLDDEGGGSVLLDWAFCGDGAVGEDVANLIIDSCTDGLMDAALLPEVAQSATDGYISGLRDGGWSGDPDAVRRSIAVCGAAKYCWFAPAVLQRAVSGDVGKSSYSKDASVQELVARLTGLVTLIARWAQSVPG